MLTETQDRPNAQLTNLRPSWGQVLLIFVCCILVAAIATYAAFIFTFGIGPALEGKLGTGTVKVLALLVSPGWFLVEIYSSCAPYQGWDFTPLTIAVLGDYAYYFCLVFSLSIWADRRWRRKRAARQSANL